LWLIFREIIQCGLGGHSNESANISGEPVVAPFHPFKKIAAVSGVFRTGSKSDGT
jgi:hypothetical protein